jgi:phage gp36-like protein
MQEENMYAGLPELYVRFTEEEINQITDTDGTGTPDPALVCRTATDAAAEIDAALFSRYTTPISPVPPLIRRIACELTRELIYLNAGSGCPKGVHESAESARGILKRLATGELRLDSLTAEAGALTSDARVETAKERLQW